MLSLYVAGFIGYPADWIGPTFAQLWLYGLSTRIDLWLLPEGDTPMLMLVMLVYTAQYMVLLVGAYFAGRVAVIARDFIAPGRHRAGLVA